MTGNAGQELPIRAKDTTGAVGNGLTSDAKIEKTSGYRQLPTNCIARLPADLILLIGSRLGKSSPSDLCHFAASTPHTWALLKGECHKKAIEIAEPTPEEFNKWLTETNGRSRFDIWAEVIDSNVENERSKFVDAVRAGKFDVVESFLAHGIDPNTHNIFGNRALNIAANGHRPLEMCKLLLKHGANPNLSDFLNSKYNGLYSAAIFAGDDVVQLLMENGADVKVKGLIHTFFQYCNADTIRRASELGADIHEVDKRGNNVLHFAARNKKAEKAEVLRLAFDLGFPSANINDRNLGGKTPLLKAVKIGHQKNVALLLEYGALLDISVKGTTALQMAFNKDDIAIVSLLAKAGADLEVVDEDGWRPLQIAAWQASEEMIQVLIENGADTSATTADQDSVLHLLLDGLDEDDNQPYIDSILRCVKLLVAAKADPRARNASGETPLDMVPEVGFDEINKALTAGSPQGDQ